MAITTCDKIYRIFLLIFNTFLFCLSLYANAYGIKNGLFDVRNGSRSNDSDRIYYDLDIIPPRWTFIVLWSITYLFQAAMIVYSLANICRPNPGGYLYYFPDILPIPFLLFYMGGWLCNISWIIVAMKAMTNVTFLSVMGFWLWLLFATLVASLYYSCRALKAHRKELIKFDLSGDIYAVLVLVHNGISIYATLSVITASINFGIALSYDGTMGKDLASTLVLIIISVAAVTYVCYDTFLLDRYTRYVFGPHCTLVLALSGCVSRMGVDIKSNNSVFVLTLLVVSSLFLIAKIVVTTVRSLRKRRGARVHPLNL